MSLQKMEYCNINKSQYGHNNRVTLTLRCILRGVHLDSTFFFFFAPPVRTRKDFPPSLCVGCGCLGYTSEDLHMTTPRHTEDSTPSEDPKTGLRKTLAKNAENVMFYHLRGGPRSEDLNGLPTLLYI